MSKFMSRRNVLWFIVNAGLITLFFFLMEVYTGAVIRTLEKRFGLSSSQSGLIVSLSDVTHVVLAVFIGYFGRRAHKPKVIAVSVLISSLGGFLMAAPHFVLQPPSPNLRPKTFLYQNMSSDSDFRYSTESTLSATKFINVPVISPEKFCRNSSNMSDNCSTIKAQNSSWASIHPAYYFFMIAQLIIGIGSASVNTLGLAYIDENSGQDKSSLYIGIFSVFMAAGPVFGMTIASATLKLPEMISSGLKRNPNDPTWIGNWWLGYVIGSTGTIILGLTIWFFPARILSENSVTRPTKQEFWKQTKEFPRRLKNLMTNKLFLCNVASTVCATYLVVGVYKNMVRYVEIHFLESGSAGSKIGALVLAVGGAVGGFGGGFLLSKLKISVTGSARIILASDLFGCICIIIILFLKCPQLNLSGYINESSGLLNMTNTCNSACSCSLSAKSYSPVCGSDGMTYFSSCMAGCTNNENSTFLGCGCVEDLKQMATPGLCKPECSMLIPYVVVLFVMTLVGALSRVPSSIVNLRIVEEEERSFSLGIKSFLNNLLGFIPGPILFGSLIDSTCILWQSTCGKTGACLHYDTSRFRNITYGTSLGFQFLDVIVDVILIILLVKTAKYAVNRVSENKNNEVHALG